LLNLHRHVPMIDYHRNIAIYKRPWASPKTDLFSAQQNQLAQWAKVLGHPARIAILQHLLEAERLCLWWSGGGTGPCPSHHQPALA
jgi:hypothetical protein